MGDFSGTTTVDVDADTLFGYLCDLNNLPDYFSRLTSAVPADADGDKITTTARTPDGGEVQGDAWFRVDETQQRVEWGAEGPSNYHGHLEVTSSSDGAQVDVSVHTTRVDDGNQLAQDSITETLATIKRLAEHHPNPPGHLR